MDGSRLPDFVFGTRCNTEDLEQHAGLKKGRGIVKLLRKFHAQLGKPWPSCNVGHEMIQNDWMISGVYENGPGKTNELKNPDKR